MNGWICEQCGSDESGVTRFYLFGKGEPGGEQKLCGDCRWTYLRKRIHGPEATGPPGSVIVPEPEPEKPSGQVSLLDF